MLTKEYLENLLSDLLEELPEFKTVNSAMLENKSINGSYDSAYDLGLKLGKMLGKINLTRQLLKEVEQ